MKSIQRPPIYRCYAQYLGVLLWRKYELNIETQGFMHHIADKDLELYVRGNLTESASALVASHAGSCKACSRKLNETTELIRRLVELSQRQGFYDGEEKRLEPRTPMDESGLLQALNPLDVDRRRVKILDVSKVGLKLHCAVHLHVGTVVQVRLKNDFILGEVRYCNPVTSGFHLGIKVQDVA